MNYRSKLSRIGLLLTVIFFAHLSVNAQITNGDYVALKATGKMPDVFKLSTEQKIELEKEKNRESLSNEEKIIFIENINYSIDELLQSGLVLYGDPATKYVQKVADNLLKDSPKLKKELQFFAVKSNVTNALSTDQGIIFVTLGLLAQIENEAQLAYVLSHEIVHYQEKHVEEFYKQRLGTSRNTSYDDRITELSNHSKEHELEADKLGIKLYHQAGYAKSELLRAFDVLMYSYLPFDEEPLPKTYFNSPRLFIPENYFPEVINPILAEEDYDDNKSSHPNIQKRKEAIINEIKEYTDWGSQKFILDGDEFKNIRDIARFESVRLDLMGCNYGDALYSIFLLESDYPDNLYLARCKSKAWLGLASFKLHGEFSKTVTKPSDVEGESHAMHFFLRKLSKIQLVSVAMREILDSKNAFPDDVEIKTIYERMVREMAGYSQFKEKDYRKITYETALERFEQSKLELIEDTIAKDTIVVEEKEELSKYDKIKKKRDIEEPTAVDEEFDNDKFYLYALTDLVGNAQFSELYEKSKREIELEEEREQALYKLSSRERIKEIAAREGTVDEVVYIDPSFYVYYYQDDRPKESALTEDLITEGVKLYAEKFNVLMHDASLNDMEKQNTDTYNQRLLLMNYLHQRGEYEEIEMFPVDYTDLQTLLKEYNQAAILFAFGNYTRTRVTHYTKLSFILIDMKTGKVRYVDSATFRKPKKMILDGYIYNVFSKLNPKK